MLRTYALVGLSGALAILLGAAGPAPNAGPELPAHAYRPALDTHVWRADIAGERTKVAVLGMTHLNQLPSFDRASLEPLLQKLAVYHPTIITHEGMAGEECETIRQNPAIYPGVFDDYCGSAQPAQAAASMDFATARAAAASKLATWPKAPTAADRRKLTLLFLASSDPMSALVQWGRLPPAERTAADGLTAALIDDLNKVKRPNESADIAVALAVRLGLERVYAVDDHTADSIQTGAGPGFESAIQAHWAAGSAAIEKHPAIKRFMTDQSALATGGDFLSFVRYANAPQTSLAFVELDYKRALEMSSPPLYGRQYVAWWEVRNLRMVANIRSAFGNEPGARVLNIVGVSHKPYYEAYLDMMHEVELVDIETVLK